MTLDTLSGLRVNTRLRNIPVTTFIQARFASRTSFNHMVILSNAICRREAEMNEEFRRLPKIADCSALDIHVRGVIS